MSARSLSSKMARSAVKSAAAGVEESSMLDMILMGAGVVVIILLLVYIYNRFIHKKPTKNEYNPEKQGQHVNEGFECPTGYYHNKRTRRCEVWHPSY